jgi:hypothetical protein
MAPDTGATPEDRGLDPKLEALVVQMARENAGWGYDRILGALSNLGYRVSDQTIGNILKRHGIAPYVLFFLHLERRRVSLAGITRHPDQAWMQQRVLLG